MNRTAIVVGLGIAATWVGLIALAGPITPPAGPVGPTAKPLSDIEPRTAINATNTPGDATSLFKIVNPGSYYLTGNITGVVNKHGIVIAASGVTLDLNGFDLVGVSSSTAFDGINVSISTLNTIAVVNGSVRNWGGAGVNLGFITPNCRVDRVRTSGNTGNGMNTGTGSVITNCSALQNAGSGMSVGNASTVSNCSATSNAGFGVGGSNGCTISNCAASSNTLIGIIAANGCTVTQCSAYMNTGSGISTGAGCTVSLCTSRANTLDGIVCGGQNLIQGNTCNNNGNSIGDGAGIHATGSGSRIEGNNCTAADRGIEISAAGNIIIRNTCSGNTSNWQIAVGNTVGPIVTAGTNAALISGSGASASTLTTTDPNANFNY